MVVVVMAVAVVKASPTFASIARPLLTAHYDSIQ